jgi:hypothetical protein
MNLMSKFNTWRRDRWIDQTIALGEQLNRLHASRYGVDSARYPEDAAYLDASIAFAESRRERLLTKLKETA